MHETHRDNYLISHSRWSKVWSWKQLENLLKNSMCINDGSVSKLEPARSLFPPNLTGPSWVVINLIRLISYFFLFPNMRSKGSGLGVEAVFTRRCATVRSRPQPSATVRNRSQPSATVRVRTVWPCLYGEFCQSHHFWRFKRRVASFGVAGVALCGSPTCFITCWTMFYLAGAILCIVFRRWLSFFVARAALWTCPYSFCVAGAALPDVSCCVFFANRIVRAASSGDNVQIPWQARPSVTCAENWRKPRTKHRFWGRTFGVHEKTCRKTSVL